MKKILLTLVLLILFIPGVSAEETTCEELITDFPEKYIFSKNGPWYFLRYYYPSGIRDLSLTLKKGESYTFFYNNADVDMSNYDFKLTGDSSSYTIDDSNQYYHVYTFKSNSYPTVYTSTFSSIPEGLIFHLVKGTKPCGITVDSGDNEETIIPDTTLDSFYTLYVDKLKILANYTLENKFLLGAIGIILLFAILELILYLFNKGGYRR